MLLELLYDASYVDYDIDEPYSVTLKFIIPSVSRLSLLTWSTSSHVYCA